MDTADYDTGFTTEFTAWTVPPELAVYPWDDAHPADRLKPGVISVHTPGRAVMSCTLTPCPAPTDRECAVPMPEAGSSTRWAKANGGRMM